MTSPSVMSSTAPFTEGRRKTGYIAGIDGWRTIAIVVVMAAHSPSRFLSDKFIHLSGWAGAAFMFGISGMLICLRLLEEERLCGRISLKGFFIRRYFRLMPLAYFFLAVTVILGILHQIPYSIPATLAAIFMFSNYYAVAKGDPSQDVYSDHFWTMSLQEHFYILIGFLMVFAGRAKRVLVLGGLTALSFFWLPFFTHFVRKSGPNLWNSGSDLQIHALLFPALVAVLISLPAYRPLAVKWLRPAFWVPAILLMFGFMHMWHMWVARALVFNMVLSFAIASTVLHQDSLPTRLLDLPPMRFVGRISYGIYIWQQIFLIQKPTVQWPMSRLQHWPFSYGLPVVMAIATYYLIERRFMAFGHRVAPPATPGRLDIAQETASTAAACVGSQAQSAARNDTVGGHFITGTGE